MKDGRAGGLALAFVIAAISIDMVGLGIIIPVAPKLISGLAHVNLSDAARYGGWLFFVYAAMQFLCAPLIGNLSDRFGRRPVLLFSLLAIGVDYLITGLAPTIGWLFLARMLSGMAGASYTTANAYIADVTPPEKRAQNFGLMGAAFSFGFIVGPAIGGSARRYRPAATLPGRGRSRFRQYRVRFFRAAGIAGKGKPPQIRMVARQSAGRAVRASALSDGPGLCAVLVLMRFAHDANPSTWTYYTMLKFHWTTKEVGWSLAFVGVALMMVYTWLLPARSFPGSAKYAPSIWVLSAGPWRSWAMRFRPQAGWLYIWIALFALMAWSCPRLNAIMSQAVGPEGTGRIAGRGHQRRQPDLDRGAGGDVLSLRLVHAPSPVYFPGAAFLAASACLVLAA